jgi:sodium-dependent phosphate transporter
MYLWILVVGGVFAFTASMGIGANDAANAFATSIGSKEK